jgi:tetratricopeptide (TPR) repeat protein
MGRVVTAAHLNSAEFSRSLARANERLRCGQSHESRGELSAAIACYDDTLAVLSVLPNAAESQRALAVAWMNRGNALQKQSTRLALNHAVCAYDRCLAVLSPLVAGAPSDHTLRNSLGAAHLNRASALLAFSAPAAALDSADRAIAALAALPLDRNIFYRANLAGAYLNRATALLATDVSAARIAARTALHLTADTAKEHHAAGHAALGARRTLLSILGRDLSSPKTEERRSHDLSKLLAEAGDLIDDGLELARGWEARHIAAFRPAAAQLFHAGAILYAVHQPHFLAEFLEENQALATALPAVVQTMLARARRTAHERCLLTQSSEPLSRTFSTLSDLSAIADRLAALSFAPTAVSG